MYFYDVLENLICCLKSFVDDFENIWMAYYWGKWEDDMSFGFYKRK